MKVMTIFGTRPEMIKMWATLKKLDSLNFEHIMVHTGQNFTPELKDFFFKDLQLRQPDFEMNIDTSSYGKEVADVIRKSDDLFAQVKPDALVILGDTYSGLSVMPAANRGIKIFHMEAGLRAWDRRMPEQRNRILIDHMSSILLPYNHYHRENLMREGIHPSKIIVSGNTTFEAMRAFQPQIEASDILQRLSLSPKDYILVTAHRSENVDNPEYLARIFEAMGAARAALQARGHLPDAPADAQQAGVDPGAAERAADGAARLLRLQQAADARLLRAVRLRHGRRRKACSTRSRTSACAWRPSATRPSRAARPSSPA